MPAPFRVDDTFPPGYINVGPEGAITVETYLRQPARVTRALEALARPYTMADELLGRGPQATGGAVVFDQVTDPDPLIEGDVQEVQPGGEFPTLTGGDVAPLVARVQTWGAKDYMTDEAVRRDTRDLLSRKLNRIARTVAKKVDRHALARFRAAPIREAGGSSWASSAANIYRDVASAQLLVDKGALAYQLDTAIISPQTAFNMRMNEQLQKAVTAATPSQSPILVNDLPPIGGIARWFVSNLVGDNEALFTVGKLAGSISDEVPFTSETWRDPHTRRTFVQAYRVPTVYITDPLSVVRMQGIA